MSRASFEETSDGENQEADCFDYGGQELSCASPAYPAPLQYTESHDDGHRDDFYFPRPRKNRKEMSTVFADDDGDRGSGATGGKPITPADDEPGIFAHRAPREIVLSPAAWNGRAKFGHCGSAE